MSKEYDKKRIHELSEKWLNGTITEPEKYEYDLWYNSFKDYEVNDITEEELDKIQEKIYQVIKQREGIRHPTLKKSLVKKKNIRLVLAAASITLIALFSIYFYHSFSDNNEHSQKSYYSTIVPGKNKATLSLNNGVIFDLDSLKDGEIWEEAGIQIKKTKKGELIYSIIDSIAAMNQEVLMNTVTTPRGGQYKISLPDGSLVWLNAATTLTFPTIFIGEERRLELAGEAYFEVAENKNMPFKVITKIEEVEVLGTHFNVNSYEEEESSFVTLLEGKVKVSIPSKTDIKILSPGQQSIIQGEAMRIQSVDLSEVIAWKNGVFMFNNKNIKSVMQEIARWYDVEVTTAPELENIFIWGTVSKYKDIRGILKIIALTDENIRFKVEGRRVYVMK